MGNFMAVLISRNAVTLRVSSVVNLAAKYALNKLIYA